MLSSLFGGINHLIRHIQKYLPSTVKAPEKSDRINLAISRFLYFSCLTLLLIGSSFELNTVLNGFHWLGIHLLIFSIGFIIDSAINEKLVKDTENAAKILAKKFAVAAWFFGGIIMGYVLFFGAVIILIVIGLHPTFDLFITNSTIILTGGLFTAASYYGRIQTISVYRPEFTGYLQIMEEVDENRSAFVQHLTSEDEPEHFETDVNYAKEVIEITLPYALIFRRMMEDDEEGWELRGKWRKKSAIPCFKVDKLADSPRKMEPVIGKCGKCLKLFAHSSRTFILTVFTRQTELQEPTCSERVEASPQE